MRMKQPNYTQVEADSQWRQLLANLSPEVAQALRKSEAGRSLRQSAPAKEAGHRVSVALSIVARDADCMVGFPLAQRLQRDGPGSSNQTGDVLRGIKVRQCVAGCGSLSCFPHKICYLGLILRVNNIVVLCAA
jgi:hypothetical protein